MKRILTTTALALTAALSMPVIAQQAPPANNAPNPSVPPMEGNPPAKRMGTPAATGGAATGTMGSSSDSGMKSSDTTNKSATGTTHRSKKPRQQGMPDVATPTSPSAPKGDSPSPAPGAR